MMATRTVPAREYLVEYAKKGEKLEDESKKEQVACLVRHGWEMLGEIHSGATKYLKAQASPEAPATEEADSADQAVESAEEKLAADLQAIRELLGLKKPRNQLLELVRTQVNALPPEPESAEALSGGLKPIVTELNSDGVNAISLRGPASDIGVFVKTVDDEDKEKEDLIARATKSHSENDYASSTFLNLLVDGHAFLYSGMVREMRNLRGTAHAEQVLGSQIGLILKQYKKQFNRDPQTLYLLISYSPCYYRCAPYLIGLRNGLRVLYPGLEMEIDFEVHYYNGDTHLLEHANTAITELQEAGILIKRIDGETHLKELIKP